LEQKSAFTPSPGPQETREASDLADLAENEIYVSALDELEEAPSEAAEKAKSQESDGGERLVFNISRRRPYWR